MGVGGNFWDILKPYARREGYDFLRDRRVAVDLSYWIVQHETAIKSVHARNPHIRLTFFRTINLFSKFGAFPVFIVDGTPSPLKSRARILRFFQASGIDGSSLPLPEEGVSLERNRMFNKCVRECVELLKLLGMPILEAKGEAEALCAQLDKDGHVDACITADSDSFLFGANCVIKCIHPNSREPFECYHISDIEAGLGLKRNHLVAISLLVGNDYDLGGVQGIGVETAVRFTKCFSEEEILDRLIEIGNGEGPLTEDVGCIGDPLYNSDGKLPKLRQSHCSFCGHPGSKRSHFTLSCSYCITDEGNGCLEKPVGFKCDCSSCEVDRKMKEQKKQENWQIKVCNRVRCEPNFPNTEIIEIYLNNDNGYFTEKDGPCVTWERPDEDMLVDFLVCHQNWEPSYIRQKLLVMHSTIYLREAAMKVAGGLLCGQYEFDSIKRVKVRHGVKSFVIKWRKAAHAFGSFMHDIPDEQVGLQDEVDEIEDSLNESDSLHIYVDDGCCFLLTDEHMDLVGSAFPEEVRNFLMEKEQKESRRQKIGSLTPQGPEPANSKSKGVQLSITEFYQSTKVHHRGIPGDGTPDSSDVGVSSQGKRKDSSPKLSKSVRRRLLLG